MVLSGDTNVLGDAIKECLDTPRDRLQRMIDAASEIVAQCGEPKRLDLHHLSEMSRAWEMT